MRILILDDDPSRSEALAMSVARASPGAEVRRARGAAAERRAANRLAGAAAHRQPRSAGRGAPDALAGLVGPSSVMQQVRALVRTAAGAEAHVLIEGETGTGKEVVARAVHALGRRAAG